MMTTWRNRETDPGDIKIQIGIAAKASATKKTSCGGFNRRKPGEV